LPPRPPSWRDLPPAPPDSLRTIFWTRHWWSGPFITGKKTSSYTPASPRRQHDRRLATTAALHAAAGPPAFATLTCTLKHTRQYAVHLSTHSPSAWLGRRVVSMLDSFCLCSTSSKIGSSPLKGCGGNCRPGGK